MTNLNEKFHFTWNTWYGVTNYNDIIIYLLGIFSSTSSKDF